MHRRDAAATGIGRFRPQHAGGGERARHRAFDKSRKPCAGRRQVELHMVPDLADARIDGRQPRDLAAHGIEMRVDLAHMGLDDAQALAVLGLVGPLDDGFNARLEAVEPATEMGERGLRILPLQGAFEPCRDIGELAVERCLVSPRGRRAGCRRFLAVPRPGRPCAGRIVREPGHRSLGLRLRRDHRQRGNGLGIPGRGEFEIARLLGPAGVLAKVLAIWGGHRDVSSSPEGPPNDHATGKGRVAAGYRRRPLQTELHEHTGQRRGTAARRARAQGRSGS